MTSDLRVALDVDSTLAATSETAFDLLGVGGEYSYGDIESWTWGLDTFGEAAYLNALWHAWSIREHDIEPTEPNLRDKTAALTPLADTLDVVTAHPQDGLMGVDEGKQRWLKRHEVFYDEYNSVEGNKHELDYDVYIDDSPRLAERVVEHDAGEMLLYDQPYNRDDNIAVDPSEYKRVWSLSDAATYIELMGDSR
ncbi:hypothetical protein PN419_00100 [Halorubrum ezzemoulense]|uniref:5' nucleotidase, NT5C type n=1 Tax=Halorubrum ezzemoulense TaxID=337243 RepID=UPI00232B5601|nr:hypothetical protein [Halorubrum ezzemoulense]MDB9247408.1 hypothetical protein [Halorubrum ezzemoulense]MDB9258683.1 hypothetical protein [Halorubrum ezzemoulense]MDB9264459.1 hypothetical protein [Halorubrum ezzemoulense]MDB9269044.1 hypothetical protein [Halorubrum ezzemoulense]MDB9271427.1 hypothetical protein [Halorubrum ezzemoulense]